MVEKQPSCDDISEPSLMPVEEARRRLFDTLRPVTEHEQVALESALQRVLATDIVSPMDVPSQANSAMDGYAIHSGSIPAQGEARLRLLGSSWAGRPFEGVVAEGEAVRIFTGAIMPSGADTVIIQEHVEASEGVIDIDDGVVAGKNVRLAGEDVAAGQQIFSAGRYLQASDIGVLASLGIRTVSVYRRLKVAFFTTGDELRALDDHPEGEPLKPGMLFDSNRYTLAALLSGLGVETFNMGIVRDDEAQTRDALKKAAEIADVVITSGGVSAGDADYVTRVFQELGEVSFWKLAMRPGRPLAYGTLGDTAFFGLPGNPVAVMVTFLQFVQPAVQFMAGRQKTLPLELPAQSLSTLRKSPGRTEYQRGVMFVNEFGVLVVESTGKQGAGRLSSMSSANCLIVIDHDINRVELGDWVRVQPFHGLIAG